MENKKMGAGVGVMILNNNKILLGQRNSDPSKADSELHGQGTWTMPGGKLDFGESFEDAACREVLEETGIKIKKEKLVLISLSNDITEEAHFVTIGFIYKEPVEEPKIMEPDEIIVWKWFTLDNLPEKMFFPSRRVLDNYLNKRLYKS